MLSRFRILSAIVFAIVFCATVGWAQQKPRANAQVLVGVNLATVDATGMVYARLYGANEADRFNYAINGPGAGTQYPLQTNILMSPGKQYILSYGSAAWNKGEVKFSAPPGYKVYLDDQPVSTRTTDTYNGGTGTLVIPKVIIRADDDSSFLPAGMALPPQVGDVLWSISAGRYASGLSAGAIQWRTSDLSPDLLNAISLVYTEPSSPEILVTRHSDGGLLEVDTFQFILYVRRNDTPGTGFTVEIYHPYATRTGSGDGPYTYSEGPYRKFIVSNPAGSWQNQIKIEKQELDGGLLSDTWTISKTMDAGGILHWAITQTNNLRVVTLLSTSGTSGRVETISVADAAGNNEATRVQRTYRNFPWGQEELTQEISDPGSPNALTTNYTYYTSAGASFGRLQTVTRPDLSWEKYIYDESSYGWGDLIAVYRPWQDAPAAASAATANNCQATLLTYTGYRNIFSDQLLTSSEKKINGTTVGKGATTYTFPGNAPNGQPLVTATTQYFSSATASLTSVATSYAPTASADFRGRPYAQINPDGTKVSSLRYRGAWFNYGDNNATNLHLWDPGANVTWGEYRFSGFSTQVQDSVPVTSWDGQAFDTVYMVPNRSTVDLDVYNSEGNHWFHVSYVFTGAPGGVASFEFLKYVEDNFYDGVQTLKHGSNGEKDQLWMMLGTLSGHTYNDGTYVEYTRDALGRDYMDRKWYIDAGSGYPAQGMIYTYKTFDIAGRVLTEKVSSSSDPAANPADAVTTARTYSKGGLLLTETAESGSGNFTTSYAYSNGGRTVTVTLPGGATKVTDNYLDGSPKSVTGTSVIPTYQTTTVNADGTITSQSNVGSSNSPRWSRATSDWLGRTIKAESPGYSGGTIVKQSFYNSIGQLYKTSETGLADILIVYNAWQQPYRAGLDVNASGALETASTDRINESDTYFEKDANGAWWSTTVNKVYDKLNVGTPLTTGTTKTRLNKFDDHGRFFGSYVQSESLSIDIFGNRIDKTVAVQRGSTYFETNLRLVTETTTYPDSSSAEITVSRNGLPQMHQSKEGLISYSYYDARGRLVKQTDPRIDTSATPRKGFVSNSDRVAWIEDSAGNRTNIAYYSDTGRVYSVTDPLGKATYTGYDALGHVIHTWGPATYPVEYTFNSYGEQTGMKTFRSGTTEWTQGAWPASPPAGDSTTWNYEAATGLLLSKTDAQNHSVAYTYNARGQLYTRTWARNVTTTYAYDPKTAEQTSITYSDGTPAVTYVYDRRGLNSSITDGLGTRTFDHCDCGKVTAEYLSAFYQNRELHWTLDTTTVGAKGRTIGLYTGTSGNGMNEYGVGFGYDAYGRVSSVMGMNYTYTPNSNLIATVADPGGAWAQYRSYEPNRNLLSSIQTKYSSATRSSFAYGHDALGRRTSLTQTGDMFAIYSGGGLSTSWGYNDRSEVTSSQTNFVNTTTAVLGRTFGYAYDPIGNRTSSSQDTATTTYTPNSLNQYTQRTNPGQVVATGLAPANANVTVNSQATTRQGEYYHKALGVSNASNPVWAGLTIASDLGGSYSRYSFVPQATEAYGYDNDGNITSDSRWIYTWDAENRLIALETAVNAYNAGIPRQRIEFRYDYLGRRVQKQVATWTTPGWSVTSQSRYLYDGWNVIREFDTTTAFNAKWTFVWGIDLSGNLQDAGGVGGLLWAYDGGTQLMPAYDGNGNVYGLVDRSTGALRAIYEYSPYGEVIRSSGDLADKNPFRFSTKYYDSETQLLYYGFRYYSPSLGRFYGRDPMGEEGGLHLYAFCRNNAINSWDLLGRCPISYSDHGDGRGCVPGTVADIVSSGETSPEAFNENSGVNPDLTSALDGAWDLSLSASTSGGNAFGLGWENPGQLSSDALKAISDRKIQKIVDEMAKSIEKPEIDDVASPPSADVANDVTSTPSTDVASNSGSTLGNALRNIPLVGGVLGGVGDIVSGVGNVALGAVTGNGATVSNGLSQIGSGVGGVAMGTLDLAGKAWNAPNTAIGLAYGLVGAGVGLVMGTHPGISIGNNAVQFTNNPLQPTAMTLGNVIVYGTGKEFQPGAVWPGNPNTIGSQEQQHTYQGQVLGPLYFPAHLVGGTIAYINNPADGFINGWHGPQNPLERGPHDPENPRPWP